MPQASRAFEDEEEEEAGPVEGKGAAAAEDEEEKLEEALSASTAALLRARPSPIRGSTIQASGSSLNSLRKGVTSSPSASKASRALRGEEGPASDAAIDERRQETASRHSSGLETCLPSAAATRGDGFHCGFAPPPEASRTAARVSGLRGSRRRR